MAGNITIPQNLTKVVDVKVEVVDTSTVLRSFLIDLLSRIEDLEAKVKELENP